MIGKVLAHRYRIRERIGGGGMALVYRAEDLQLGRDVAIKVLRGQFGSDEEFVRRFRREAQSAASLSHPNVVQIYDVGKEEDRYFIVMELVEGKTLKEVIQEQGPLPVAEAARIAAEILSALSHAHWHKIVHRDIKPHNILIAKDGRVKVTDFGIARATTTDTVTHTTGIMGSAHYFSPEQANGGATGEKSDIYSVGVVLYEMVTGVVPFQGDSPITVALKHIREEPAPPSQLNPEVPVELERIILRALRKEPEERYPSAEAMRQALEQFRADHAAGATHIQSGDFPTMDLRAMGSRKLRRRIKEKGRAAVVNHYDEDIYEEDEEEPPRGRRRRSRTWLWVLVFLLIVTGGIGFGVYKVMEFLEVPEVAVPDVRNMEMKEAIEVLKKQQLRWTILAYQYNTEVERNHIIWTEPEPGERVKIGREIALTVSNGPEERNLPNVVGRTLDEARALLESERFLVGEVTEEYAPEPEGTVIEMMPAPLTPLPVGSYINLVVSKGPLKVPPIYGKAVEEATRLIEEAELRVGRVEEVPDPTKPEGTVVASSPREGTPVVRGQTVDLFVATGPTTPGISFRQEIMVPGSPNQVYDLTVTLVDTINGIPSESAPLEQSRRRGREKVTVEGTYYGEAYLRVLVSGEEIRIPLSRPEGPAEGTSGDANQDQPGQP